MSTVAGIAVAGSAGALARYGIEGAVARSAPGAFPWGTFAVNVSGSLLVAFVFTLLTERVTVDPSLRTVITIGFLGAYTTFSTLTFETYRLLSDGGHALALANALGSLAAGLAAVYLGVSAARSI